eukprot:1345069-Pyramimonas_sp.AAC.1
MTPRSLRGVATRSREVLLGPRLAASDDPVESDQQHLHVLGGQGALVPVAVGAAGLPSEEGLVAQVVE